jgi:hypothetical protein
MLQCSIGGRGLVSVVNVVDPLSLKKSKNGNNIALKKLKWKSLKPK